jgi:hypothetical protein
MRAFTRRAGGLRFVAAGTECGNAGNLAFDMEVDVTASGAD